MPVPAERWHEFARVAKDELGCRFFIWLSAVDWKEQGFEIVCRVENLDARLAVMLRPGSDPARPLFDPHRLFRGADWMERECFDMFGVVSTAIPICGASFSAGLGRPSAAKDYAVDTPSPVSLMDGALHLAGELSR